MLILEPKIKLEMPLIWEPLLRLRYKLGFRKYDLLVDVGLSELSFQKHMKILLSRKTNEKEIVEEQKPLIEGIIIDPAHSSPEKLLNELIAYAYELEIVSKKISGEISEYAKKITMWNKYMRFPDASAKSIIKMLRRKVFDKNGIFMLKGLLKEGFGISSKTRLDRIKVLEGSGQIIYLPLYVEVLGARVEVFDATFSGKHLSTPYTSLMNNDIELLKKIVRKIKEKTESITF